eukprot:evm.model.scf_44.7 EVM.evm.TU.scf_44.7   scf_44:111469-113379(-)
MEGADPLLGHGRYVAVRVLCRSDHALVVEATDAERAGEVVAVKILGSAGATLGRVRPIFTSHPHILRLRDVFEFRGGLGVAMELADRGNMREFMTSRGGDALDEVTGRFYFQQLLLAVDYVHARGGADMGLKLENLLLFKAAEPDAEYPVLRVANQLGMATNDEPEDRASYGYSPAGRIPDYTAPEAIVKIGEDATMGDVWSCGVLLYVMLCGRFPFTGTRFNVVPDLNPVDRLEICKRIQAQEYTIPPSLSEGSADVIGKCLVSQPQQRITINGLLSHPWFQIGLPTGAADMNELILKSDGLEG